MIIDFKTWTDRLTSLRFRDKFIIIGWVLTFTSFILTDPDLGIVTDLMGGAMIVTIVLALVKTIPYILMLHLARKALLDYVNLKSLYTKALEEPCGAGLMAIAIGLFSISISMVIYASVVS